MKKNYVIFILIVIALSGCNKKVGAETSLLDEGKDTNRAAVTFIELGSINCVPCKMMQPLLEQVEIDFGARVEVVFHDVWTDEGQPYAVKYQIQAIPTQVFLDKDGNEYFRHLGFFPKDELYKILEQGLEIK